MKTYFAIGVWNHANFGNFTFFSEGGKPNGNILKTRDSKWNKQNDQNETTVMIKTKPLQRPRRVEDEMKRKILMKNFRCSLTFEAVNYEGRLKNTIIQNMLRKQKWTYEHRVRSFHTLLQKKYYSEENIRENFCLRKPTVCKLFSGTLCAIRQSL